MTTRLEAAAAAFRIATQEAQLAGDALEAMRTRHAAELRPLDLRYENAMNAAEDTGGHLAAVAVDPNYEMPVGEEAAS